MCLTSTSQAKSKYNLQEVSLGGEWNQVINNNRDQCNVLFVGSDGICEGGNCFFASNPAVYHRIRPIIRCKMMHSKIDMPPLRYDTNQYNVAWHIRAGLLHMDDVGYYTRCSGHNRTVLTLIELIRLLDNLATRYGDCLI